MNVFYIIHDDELIRLEVGTAIGSGGEGKVYPITSPKSWLGFCVKEYIEKYRISEKEAKLQFMIARPPAELSNTHGKLCWPVAIAYDAGFTDFVGFVMPLAYSDSQELYLLSNLTNRRLGEKWQPYFDESAASFDKRLTVALNLCAVVDLIYQSGNYAIVDFKPQNIMFTPDGKVALVDLDSIQIAADEQGQPHYGRVNTVEYTPPEGRDITVKDTLVDETWDAFSLAVILYQILLGIHPYMATFKSPYNDLNSLSGKIQQNLFVHDKGKPYVRSLPPLHERFKSLPHAIQQLFKVSFDNNTDRRTSAKQWEETLSGNSAQNLPTKAIATAVARVKASGPPRLFYTLVSYAKTTNNIIIHLSKNMFGLLIDLINYQAKISSSSIWQYKPSKTIDNINNTHTNKQTLPNQNSSNIQNQAHLNQAQQPPVGRTRVSKYKKRSYVNDKPPTHAPKKKASTLLDFTQPHLTPSHLQSSNSMSSKLQHSQQSKLSKKMIATGNHNRFLKWLTKLFKMEPVFFTVTAFMVVLYGALVLFTDNDWDTEPATYSEVASVTDTSNEIVDNSATLKNNSIKDSTDNSIFDTDIAGKAINDPDADALIKAGVIPLPGPPLPYEVKATLSPDKRYEVLLKVTTDASGNIDHAEMLMPSYNALLDVYTLSTFQNMTFESQPFEKRPIERDMIFLIYYQ